jgi:DNA-binding NtrC family response regulator
LSRLVIVESQKLFLTQETGIMRTVLVIDDNPAVRSALNLLFGLHDIRVLVAGSVEEGLQTLAQPDIELVIADMNFTADTTSGEEGVALYNAIRQLYPDLPVILLMAWTHLDSAVRLVKAGAADYLAKPWDDLKLVSMVENLLELYDSTRERNRIRRDRMLRRDSLMRDFDVCDVIFVSEAMERCLQLACRVARAQVPVLITDPSGSGKEKIAEIVHANSGSKGPFVALNCAAVPAGLLEAELFGAEAGAYTDARNSRRGRFESAHGGTLFLDEIGDLPLLGQVKLLHVIETGRFERIGSNQSREVKVRVLSATNANLPLRIRSGAFREDLFYRLNGVEITVPPLAERVDDIIPLAEHFMGSDGELADDAQSKLLGYDWPGNVRELRNAMERAKLVATSQIIRAKDLNLPQSRLRRSAEDFDRLAIEDAPCDRRAASSAVLPSAWGSRDRRSIVAWSGSAYANEVNFARSQARCGHHHRQYHCQRPPATQPARNGSGSTLAGTDQSSQECSRVRQ